MFQKVLVANRSEIAIRAFRAATELGIRTVAVYAYEDRYSPHRLKADESYQIVTPGHPLRSYLDVDSIVSKALQCDADAMYPGYGFLSENLLLARACEGNGIKFISPSAQVLALAGTKVKAIEAASQARIPVLQSITSSSDPKALAIAAEEIGFPVFVKAAGGVGLSAVTIATLLNARVTASARHPEHHQYLKTLGATPVLPEKVSENGPYDVILELVGGINMEQNVSNLNDDGRISVIGVGAGAKCEIDLRLVMSKRARIFGSTLRARSTQSKAALVHDARTKLIPLLDQGKLPMTVAGRFDFKEAAKAYERFSTPGKLGKILLTF